MIAELNTSTESYNAIFEEQGVKITLTPSKRKKVKKINIVIEGVFTLNNAALVKDKIYPVLKDFDTLDIALKNILQIDLAAIQLVHTLKNTENKLISVDADLTKEDRALLFHSGLMGLLTKTKLTD